MTTKPPQNALLTHKQEIVLAALMEGKNRREAAEAAGCNRRTIHDWMEPGHAFRVEYDRRVAELHSVVRDRFRAILDAGSGSLVHMLAGLKSDFDDADADTRVRIANSTKAILADIADRTGHIKSERVEVNDTTDRTASGLRDDARDGAASLKLLVGGRAEKV